MYLLRCLKRKTAVLKLTGGREWRRVSKHWALASGSDRPVGGRGSYMYLHFQYRHTLASMH